MFLGQGISGNSGENMKNIWEVDAGDTTIQTVILENIAIDPPFNEFRTIQFMASPVWSPVGSYGVSFFTIDSLMVQDISLATGILDVENKLTVSVFPNPANNWTTFKYEIPGSTGDATIQVSDIFGKIVERFSITEKQGQKIWNTRKVQSGVYFYTFTVNGFSKSGKIVISN